ncbi:MAG TPA: ParA family protein [Microthrixaceae bacterium]|nr:ParA family protein [Microthrixaceae bacterium]
MTTLAVVNQKGGVGKTTVALGLAAVAARRDLSVVVVDLDPQANATSGMGVWSPVHTVAHGLAADTDGALVDVVAATGWGPDLFDVPPRLAPSSPDLAQLEPQMAVDPIGAQDRLRRALIGVDADLVIIDCPPSLGLLTINGLFAADHAVIVTEPSAWAVDGVAQILRNISRIAERRNGTPTLSGVVVNRLARTRDARYWDEQLVETYGPDVIRPAIALKAAVAEASAQSLPITAVTRAGAAEAAAQFDAVLDRLVPAAPSHPEASRDGVADAAL